MKELICEFFPHQFPAHVFIIVVAVIHVVEYSVEDRSLEELELPIAMRLHESVDKLVKRILIHVLHTFTADDVHEDESEAVATDFVVLLAVVVVAVVVMVKHYYFLQQMSQHGV